jgi:predicted DNA-binding transcriptional regulator AlpA
MNEPATLREGIPIICTVTDVLRILRLSESQFYKLRRENKFPIREIPALDSTLRFRGADLAAFIERNPQGQADQPPRRRFFGRVRKGS